jgi:hypothetical protein
MFSFRLHPFTAYPVNFSILLTNSIIVVISQVYVSAIGMIFLIKEEYIHRICPSNGHQMLAMQFQMPYF